MMKNTTNLNVLIIITDNYTDEANNDLTNIITPVKVKLLKKLLWQSGYDNKESNYLVQGFTYGFSLEN